jgi:hypothetical protein
MKTIISALLCLNVLSSIAQQVPAAEENIPFLVTFGKESAKAWGDDDYCQTFFFVVPESTTNPIYIRVFDPDVGGAHDEIRVDWNTKTRFSVFGGVGAISNADAKGVDPTGNFKSGSQLATKVFDQEKYDNEWYTFGPFYPKEGELDKQFGGYIFKVICEGIAGDDGNLYRYFLSSDSNKNIPIDGGNAFTYEYTFRMHDDPKQVSHIYPYIDSKVTSVKQTNFDWDNDGIIKIVSRAKPGILVKTSGENEWSNSEHKIDEEELNSSLDFQFIKSKNAIARNNVVISIRNQYGELLPFYAVPIGGIPKYKSKIQGHRN